MCMHLSIRDATLFAAGYRSLLEGPGAGTLRPHFDGVIPRALLITFDAVLIVCQIVLGMGVPVRVDVQELKPSFDRHGVHKRAHQQEEVITVPTGDF